MKNIALIDDKEYWIIQIKNAIPENIQYEFYYFSSYQEALWKHFDIIFLDYYLDIDWITSDDIIDELSGDIIIWFSSVQECNEKLIKKWASFWVEKLKAEYNPELENIVSKIL